MKIYDCFMYFDEDLILEIRLNSLSSFVDKFIIVESKFNHKGEKRIPNFNITKFNKFKNKIEYILTDEQPKNIEKINKNEKKDIEASKFIMNAVKQENFQRNIIANSLKDCEEEDWIIISDLDEIPKLDKINFKEINKKFIFFKQYMIYYKLNLVLENFTWTGSKACKKKYLKSPQWLRNIKDRSYPWWRIDILFSDKKYKNIKFIDEGGWHFTNIKNPKDIEKKMKSYLHHYEYDNNPLGIKKINQLINDRKALYNIRSDMRLDKFRNHPDLKLLELNKLPKYVYNNKNKFLDWIEK